MADLLSSSMSPTPEEQSDSECNSSSFSTSLSEDVFSHHPLHYIYCLTKQNTDNVISRTVLDQHQTEKSCLEMYQRHFQHLAPHPYDLHSSATVSSPTSFNDDLMRTESTNTQDIEDSEKDALWQIAMNRLKLNKKSIFFFCGKYMDEPFPEDLMELEASRGWMLYWIAHVLELLNLLQVPRFEEKVLRFLDKCWDAAGKGGWGGGPGQLGHLATTYACSCLLLISESVSKWISPHEDLFNTRTLVHVLKNSSLPDPRYQLYRFLMSRKNPQGGFAVHRNGEIDMRGTYCAIATASMFNMITPELEENIVEYMKACQTYEGGIAAEPNHEAHGGYTYCALATLCILGKAHELDLDKLLDWAVHRQMGFEGGFQGRSLKLVDSCYSFWVGTILSLIAEAFRQARRSIPSDHRWFDEKKLQQYLLCCCQTYKGGFADKPGRSIVADFYHTCYAISGISVAQNCIFDNNNHISKNKHILGKKNANNIPPIHILYNVRLDKAYKNQKDIQRYPFVVEKRFDEISKQTQPFEDFQSPPKSQWGKMGDSGSCGKRRLESNVNNNAYVIGTAGEGAHSYMKWVESTYAGGLDGEICWGLDSTGDVVDDSDDE